MCIDTNQGNSFCIAILHQPKRPKK
ncbi:MAG: AgrD family cyclic lactone autoinducer peptide [Waltera sp.]